MLVVHGLGRIISTADVDTTTSISPTRTYQQPVATEPVVTTTTSTSPTLSPDTAAIATVTPTSPTSQLSPDTTTATSSPTTYPTATVSTDTAPATSTTPIDTGAKMLPNYTTLPTATISPSTTTVYPTTPVVDPTTTTTIVPTSTVVAPPPPAPTTYPVGPLPTTDQTAAQPSAGTQVTTTAPTSIVPAAVVPTAISPAQPQVVGLTKTGKIALGVGLLLAVGVIVSALRRKRGGLRGNAPPVYHPRKGPPPGVPWWPGLKGRSRRRRHR